MSIYYHDNELYLEQVALKQLALTYGTPLYVYSKERLLSNIKAYKNFAPDSIHYAVKANNNLALLQIMKDEGVGFDTVSKLEIEKCLLTQVNPEQIIFSGVGKTLSELEYAMRHNILINIESAAEYKAIGQLAQQLGLTPKLGLRINPEVEALTHPFITTACDTSKFGLSIKEALALMHQGLRPYMLSCHIGSQIISLQPFIRALNKMLALVQELEQSAIKVERISIGGGLGIAYNDEAYVSIKEYGQALTDIIKQYPRALQLHFEPGRSLIANCAVLLGSILYEKPSVSDDFLITDLGMNDFIRTALYQAPHKITLTRNSTLLKRYHIVGPVCESSDSLGVALLPQDINNNYIALYDAGAYGYAMASNYNLRMRPAEVLVSGSEVRLIRRRETLQDLLQLETNLN